MIRTFAQGGAPAQNPDQGLDLDSQVQAGLESFAQSQDPAIAVEICNMLVQMYGISPEVDPYADQGGTGGQDLPVDQVPMARNGAKIRAYKNGGQVKKYAAGGPGGPGKSTGPGVSNVPGAKGPTYRKQNPALTPQQNQANAQYNIAAAQALKNGLVGQQQAPLWDNTNPQTNFVFDTPGFNRQANDVRYSPISLNAIQQADSVLGTGPAVRANAQRLAASGVTRRYKNGGVVGPGKGKKPEQAKAPASQVKIPGHMTIDVPEGFDPDKQFLPSDAIAGGEVFAQMARNDAAQLYPQAQQPFVRDQTQSQTPSRGKMISYKKRSK